MSVAASTSAFTGKAIAQKITTSKSVKANTVVKASANKAVSLAAVTAVVLSATPAAFAATGIELTDKRVENQTGLQLIYEARDLELDQKPRSDGPSRFSFQKLSQKETAARATESVTRINKDVGEYVGKKYWTQASNELRRQVGTLRFDINNLVEIKGADAAQAKAFYKKLENLDFSIRQKDQEAATALLADVQETASALLASLA
ncbi:psbQ, PSII-Q, OEE3, photosystem II polypeptide, oxygen evolving enhancer 3 [Ostreococcus lucimarinus CCE9901]|uniref:PsbQ, PSII-Q, OEE3, photosystem II polypeptide, oxygen evolving enhancer 3 n=1 Tax=Ostreococcus lucimarinus (strain CCE9901) TaxID=436017 RepID=A4S8C8_OSTLU|nr:psbQ, PSII-Q, OEE3, photosystem II polypeptide, oxygen evolving enhancer 3 [Ostreococcus lucimarinus CCE9901]ABP00039.1 psbQ, PSII-Q, OEE3, photosystem II polypeptide, oxygen evolving enhancer 3 [Ostreococcus lucimarinus CCE9901]|eukprot:XP_001421745.1 psbQ, PSII-Q, OEE3, photosystem II polypeptide, oxygen evolving enhancer 3 [Ostreococcus lucimarinus CCE9901]